MAIFRFPDIPSKDSGVKCCGPVKISGRNLQVTDFSVSKGGGSLGRHK
jgi:hypothetical protein